MEPNISVVTIATHVNNAMNATCISRVSTSAALPLMGPSWSDRLKATITAANAAGPFVFLNIRSHAKWSALRSFRSSKKKTNLWTANAATVAPTTMAARIAHDGVPSIRDDTYEIHMFIGILPPDFLNRPVSRWFAQGPTLLGPLMCACALNKKALPRAPTTVFQLGRHGNRRINGRNPGMFIPWNLLASRADGPGFV